MKISPLKKHPAFADTIAHRGWHAWWTESDVSLADYRSHLDPLMQGEGIPFGLVAHENDVYAGSVLVIENDLDERLQYTPWIAALWVEPQFRRQGVAARLIVEARSEVRKAGHASCYLCAAPDKRHYYLKQGFSLIESGVAGLDVFVT